MGGGVDGRGGIDGISVGIYLISLTNLGLAPLCLRNPALERSAGSLFGREGGGTLVLWAFTYISIASSYARVPW